jgi:hypothetical protein
MFKSGSIETELMHSMEKQLVSTSLEAKHSFNKLAKVLDYINAAANIFDKAGLHQEAIELTSVLKKVAEWEDEMSGGRADKKNPKDFDPKALEKGIKVEKEHTSDPHIATEIAMDHLTEDPKYYDKLEKMEAGES